MNLLILFVVFCEFYIQGTTSSYYNNRDLSHTNSKKVFPNENYERERYKYNSSEKNLYQPVTNKDSGYGLKTVHTSSAYIPAYNTGPPIQVVPDNERTDYYFVRMNKTSMNIPYHEQYPNNVKYYKNNQPNVIPWNQSLVLSPSTNRNRPQRRNHLNDCVKCPTEKILIAQKGLDGVLIDPPKLFSCQNRVLLNNAYQVETLFGSEFKFLLGHGTHSFHAKIRNTKTGKLIQTCILRYKIIVQQCGRFFPQDSSIRTKCDPGYIWGSKCHFSCRTGYLSKSTPMICSDRLQWEGDEPECLSKPPAEPRNTCSFNIVPENGRLSCEYPVHMNSEKFKNELVTPGGSLCRIICNRNYEIPQHLQPYSLIKCQDGGRWNSTILNICQPKTTRYF